METRDAATAWIKSGRPYALSVQENPMGSRLCVTYEDEAGHRCHHLSRRISRPTMRECGHEALRWLRRLGVEADKAAAFAARNFGVSPEATAEDPAAPPPPAAAAATEEAACTKVLERSGHGIELIILSATAPAELDVVLAAEEKHQAGDYYDGDPPVVVVGLPEASPAVLAWFRRHGREMTRHP